MKSRQLANVLIKMLGLSIFLHTIPWFVSGIILAITQLETSGIRGLHIGQLTLAEGVMFVVGIVIIIMSKTVAAWLFKSDED